MTNLTMATNTTYLFPDHWNDLYQLDQPLDMDAFLQSDLLAARRSLYMKASIALMVSGPISFIASTLLVVHILRSHESLSTTYHRLIFGLSVSDIISSFGYTLSSTVAPKEMSYLVPFASGNIMTCDAQGFLNVYATGVSLGYTCSVCFYYLAIISYNKKFDYIRRNLEPWFHGISILYPLVFSGILLATNAYNGPDGGPCYPELHDPPHCIGYEAGYIPKGYSIPCGRGGGESDGLTELRTITMFGAWVWGLIIAPVTILFTMASMFRSVTSIEKQMQKYGVRALRFRTTLTAPTTNDNSTPQQEVARGFAGKMKKLGKYLCLTADASQKNHHHRFTKCCFTCPCVGNAGCYDPENPSRTTKSNKMTSQKRAILHMAFGYAGAWLLVWSFYFVFVVFFIVTKSAPGDAVAILGASMIPLQGFCNFVVFMAPKLRTTRTLAMRRGRRGRSSDNNNQIQQHLTWCEAFYKAYMSRGRRLENTNMRNNNRTERSTAI